MKTNIIFLDIDGVLNGYNIWNQLGWKVSCMLHLQKMYKKYTRSPFGIHTEKIKRLAKIVHKTDAKIVMSSSWRNMFWKVPIEQANKNVQKLHLELDKHGIEVIDITPKSSDGRRDKEIKEWLENNSDKVKNFVILDDERFDLECFVGTHLVQTSSVKKGQMIKGHWHENTGLKNHHIKEAIKIFRKGDKLCIQ